MPFHIVTGTAAPSTAPEYLGQHYVDTTNKDLYEAAGTSDVGDWQRIGKNSFPPSNGDAPLMGTNAPGSDNLAAPFPEPYHWFRMVMPTPSGDNIRVIFTGMGAELWSMGFYDDTGVLVTSGSSTPVVGSTGTMITVPDSSFTEGDTYYLRIINHDQLFAATGTVHYTHAA